ncbi:MAG: hypothetical protein WC346_09155 [Methanogenium sp.]|jgi:hypothetical protein
MIIYYKKYDNISFWKIKGSSTWSRDIMKLCELINQNKDNFSLIEGDEYD